MAIFTFIFSISYTIFNYQKDITWLNLVFIITGFIGVLISIILLWYDIDAHNPFVREVCGNGGQKTNCDIVLKSSKSSFLGVSWATWGFAYMATLFSTQIFFIENLSFIYLSSILSLIVTPYILFSIYYQAKIINQWCPLCLAIQALLFVNSLTAIIFIFNSNVSIATFSGYAFFINLFLILFFATFTYQLVPLVKSARENNETKKRWKRLRYNPEVFQSLLDRSEKVLIPAKDLGIVIGNPSASNEIIKICNPYCVPCARAHPELESIIKNNSDVKVRIIFTASGEDDDKRTAPVTHLLAIEETRGQKEVHRALDDWYLANEKNYESFASKYPIGEELMKQKDKITAMKNWCDRMKIRATPTLFINGSELPSSYNISELKNFF